MPIEKSASPVQNTNCRGGRSTYEPSRRQYFFMEQLQTVIARSTEGYSVRTRPWKLSAQSSVPRPSKYIHRCACWYHPKIPSTVFLGRTGAYLEKEPADRIKGRGKETPARRSEACLKVKAQKTMYGVNYECDQMAQDVLSRQRYGRSVPNWKRMGRIYILL